MNFQDVSQSYRQKNPTLETLTGIVERITFYAEESGYTVARLQCRQQPTDKSGA